MKNLLTLIALLTAFCHPEGIGCSKTNKVHAAIFDRQFKAVSNPEGIKFE